jgi:hypothetical protein
MDHNWLTESATFLSNDKEAYVPFRPTKEIDMDLSIIQHMEQMGLEKKTTIQAVLTGKFNQAAGVYYSFKFLKLNGAELKQIEVLTAVPEHKFEPITVEERGMGEELAMVLMKLERERTASLDEEALHMDSMPKILSRQQTIRSRRVKQSKPVLLPKISEINSKLTQTFKNKIPEQTSQVINKKPGSFSGPNQTKFGLSQPNKNVLLQPLPLDDSLYQNSPETLGEIGVRTIKFALNCICQSKLEPRVYFDRLTFVLDKFDIVWQNQDYLCNCEWGDISFEAEICKLPNIDTFGVRIKRQKGEIWDFKKLIMKFTTELDTVLNNE